MNTFELFTMMYFVLDEEWEEYPNEELRQFLSDIDPFIWGTCVSADPAYYPGFQKFCKGKTIGNDYGYAIVIEYLETIPEPVMTQSFEIVSSTFKKLSVEEWIEGAKEYLAEPHKGDSLPEDLPFEAKHEGGEFAPSREAEREHPVSMREPALV
jgi:hypothetical protein